ncbi:MAG TPA: hypothetical protein VFC39_11365 [Acidobacteriaceae bacterium]|nr:hypothetical protein [Acidobacteriaceae bacterium]
MNVVEKAARHFPAPVVSGPCPARKTTLFRHAYPQTEDMRLSVRSMPG